MQSSPSDWIESDRTLVEFVVALDQVEQKLRASRDSQAALRCLDQSARVFSSFSNVLERADGAVQETAAELFLEFRHLAVSVAVSL